VWGRPLGSRLLITLSSVALVKGVTSPLAVSASGTRCSGQGPTRLFAFAIAVALVACGQRCQFFFHHLVELGL
jgi:hypothetical protein